MMSLTFVLSSGNRQQMMCLVCCSTCLTQVGADLLQAVYIQQEQEEQLELARLLVAKGATDADGATPLYVAVAAGLVPLLQACAGEVLWHQCLMQLSWYPHLLCLLIPMLYW
jgi:hypothetical protein